MELDGGEFKLKEKRMEEKRNCTIKKNEEKVKGMNGKEKKEK